MHKRRGIELDARGSGVGRVETEPEALLPRHDLVFAQGRSALEAMAVGTAVIVCGAAGCGPMVTTANFDALRTRNFGYRTLSKEHTVETVGAAIETYASADAARVSLRVRTVAGLDAAVDVIVRIYERAIAEQRVADVDPAAESRAAAPYLEWLAPVVKQGKSAPLPWTRRRLRERLARGADALSRWLRRR